MVQKLLCVFLVVTATASFADAQTETRMDRASLPAIASEHALGLEGAANFRDVGGYTAAGGRQVRRGLLFRSGELSQLTPADAARVDALELTSVIDLRTEEERDRAPSVWLHAPPDLYESPKDSVAPIMHSVLAGAGTAEGAKTGLVKFYAGMPDLYRDEYAEMFHRLAAGRVPMLVHCTAGKDRTGVAIAVLLSSLGVPRQTVIDDYELTERLVPPAAAAARRPGPVGGAAQAQAALALLPEESRVALWRSDPAYIESALASIDQEYGSVEAYLHKGLKLSAAEIEALRVEFLR